jgi:hypothetical protein
MLQMLHPKKGKDGGRGSRKSKRPQSYTAAVAQAPLHPKSKGIASKPCFGAHRKKIHPRRGRAVHNSD